MNAIPAITPESVDRRGGMSANARRNDAPTRRPREFGEYDDDMRREYARYLFEAGRAIEAIRELDGLMAAGSADAGDYELRGRCRQHSDGEIAQLLAIADFEHALRLPGVDRARVQLAIAARLNTLGRHVEALERVDEPGAAQKYPEAALAVRADALIGLRRPRELVAVLNACPPYCPDVRARAGLLLRETGCNAEALGQFAIVARARPDDRHVLWAIGDCLAALGRRAEAVAWFERAEQAYRDDGDGMNAEICHRARDQARGRRGMLAWLLAR